MNLWDLTRLLFRRWYFVLPMLLVSVFMVVVTAQSVRPDYGAKGYVQMIPPPSVGRTGDASAKPRPTNPWLDLGYAALGTAAVIAVTEPSQLKTFPGRGLSAQVGVVLSPGTSTLFEIEVVGDSPAQATATVREIIKRLDAAVIAAQRQYNVQPQDTITTLPLNNGEAVEVITSRVQQVVIAVAALGLLITAAGTIGLDALVRRRRRRSELDPVVADLAPPTRQLGWQPSGIGRIIILDDDGGPNPQPAVIAQPPARTVYVSSRPAIAGTVAAGTAPVLPAAPSSSRPRPAPLGDEPGGVGSPASIRPAISAVSVEYRLDAAGPPNGRVFGTRRPEPPDETDEDEDEPTAAAAEPDDDQADERETPVEPAATEPEDDDPDDEPLSAAAIVLPLAQTSWLKDGRPRRRRR